TQRDDRESDVRRAGLEGIAILAANFEHGDQHFADNPALADALTEAASDSDPRTRAAAAVALGVIGSEPFQTRLRAPLDDSGPDARYNAAVRLAHWGDPAVVPTLVEMLDPGEQAGIETERQEDMRPFKRSVIQLNALRAAAQWAEQHSLAESAPLVAAI